MDIFEFRATNMVNVEGVFEAYTNDESDLGGIFMRLKNLMVSENHTKWDIAYLETYTKHSMVPRSLRWDIAPQKGDVDLEGWFKYFNQAGISLIKFLIERKTFKLAKLDDEIKNIKEKLHPYMGSEEYSVKSQSLMKILEKEDKDQRIKKKKKFNRNLSDYHGKIVFDWQKKLLEELAKQNNNEMEISTTMDPNTPNRGPQTKPFAVHNPNKRGAPHAKPMNRIGNEYHQQSPRRENGGNYGGFYRGQPRPSGPPRPIQSSDYNHMMQQQGYAPQFMAPPSGEGMGALIIINVVGGAL